MKIKSDYDSMTILRQFAARHSQGKILMDVADAIVENCIKIGKLSARGYTQNRAAIDDLNMEATELADALIKIPASTPFEADRKFAAVQHLFMEDEFARQLIGSLASDYCELMSKLRTEIKHLRQPKRMQKAP